MTDVLLDAVAEFIEAVEAKAGRIGILSADLKGRSLWAALRADQAERQVFDWTMVAAKRLEEDRAAILKLAEQHLTEEKADEPKPPTPAQRRRFIAAATAYLEGPGKAAWKQAAETRIAAGAERSVTTLASDLGFRFDLLRPGIAKYVEKETGFLIRSITDTTSQAVQDAVAEGIEDGLGAKEIAKNLEGLPAFNRDRALLVARTEATRVTNGAPTESLQATSAETGRKFTKTWNGVLDDRERPEHLAMEQETVGLDEDFSNGLPFPSEPNCRCVLTYAEVTA